MAFQRRYDATRAVLKDGFWQLTGVTENRVDAAPARAPSLAIPATVDPSDLLSRFIAPENTSFWALPGVIRTVKGAGLSATPYELRWHRLMATPLSLTAMALLAALFSLGIERFGGRGRMAFLAVGAALSVYLANDLSGALAQADVAPAWAAAWCPTLVALFLSLWAISVREDG
jgi:lipopolysaccharide export system permease protein